MNKAEYERPQVIAEGWLEVQAGSPTGFCDPWDPQCECDPLDPQCSQDPLSSSGAKPGQ